MKQLESEGRMATPSEQKILTEEEYESASAAQTNAFYTHPKIAQAIWNGLEKLGFKGGRILDPSMGSGIFFGTMPSEIAARSELTGVEKDISTGGIAKQLYQVLVIFSIKKF